MYDRETLWGKKIVEMEVANQWTDSQKLFCLVNELLEKKWAKINGLERVNYKNGKQRETEEESIVHVQYISGSV